MVNSMDNQNEIYPGGDNQPTGYDNMNQNQYGGSSSQGNYPNSNPYVSNTSYNNQGGYNQGGYPASNPYGANPQYNNQGGYPNQNQYGGYPSYDTVNQGGYQNNMGQPAYSQYDPNMNPQGGYQTYNDNAYLMANSNGNPYYSSSKPQSKSKVAAGLLAIFLGCFGVHKFYLGYAVPGIIMVLVSVLTCLLAAPIMEIIGLIEGIKYLCMSDEEFYQTYVENTKGWF